MMEPDMNSELDATILKNSLCWNPRATFSLLQQPRTPDTRVLVQLLHLLLQTREHLPAEEEGEEGARAAQTGACAKEERAPFNFAARSIWL